MGSTCSALISEASQSAGIYGRVMPPPLGTSLPQWGDPRTPITTFGRQCKRPPNSSIALLICCRRGWTVLPLDPSSFQVVNTFEAFCGDPNKYEIAAGCLDIANSLCRVPGHSESVAADSNNESAGSESTDEDSDSSDRFDVTDSDEEYYAVIAAGIELETASSHNTEIESIDAGVPSSSDERSPIEDDGPSETVREEESATSNLVRVDSRLLAHENLSATWPLFVIPGDYNSSETYGIQAGSDGAKKLKLRDAGSLSTTQQLLEKSMGPIVPTLHLSASHLRVFNPNSPNEASIYCSHILDLQQPMYYATSRHIDRLNMTQYIPELGIVVIATQIGRAAVCSLTRNGSKGPYGLRVDWILPFQAQERNGERPLAPLLGIAVGPVQGHQVWRSSSVSEDDEDTEEPWLRDRVDEDGVLITFDPEIVRLRRNSSSSSSTGTGTDKDSEYRPAKRYKPSERRTKHRKTRPPNPRLARQAWPSRSEVKEGVLAVLDESWRGLEYSRRYRLMLTYADHSVMTYELSREAPFVGDPAAGRPNWRNRDVFL
jgi:CRT10